MLLKAHSRPRGLLAILFAFAFVTALLLPDHPSLAKTPYEIHDSSEGDPGDGVLRPVPEIEPIPQPSIRTFGVVFTLDVIGVSGYDQPVVLLLPVSLLEGSAEPARWDRLSLVIPEGRWQDAP